MVDVLALARHILEQQGRMTTLKLQKLVYYAQAWAAASGEPLFDDTIKAWAQGPVVPALFQEHQGLRHVAASDLPAPAAGAELGERERALVDRVLEHYGDLPAAYLSQLTHHERPWREARAGGAQHGHGSPAIPLAALRDFYAGRTPEDLDTEYQLVVAGELMDQHAQCLARLAL